MADIIMGWFRFVMDNVEIFFCVFWLAAALGWYCLGAFKSIPKK